MKKPPQKNSHPHIHRQETAPSPYVIDLRRAEAVLPLHTPDRVMAPPALNPFLYDLQVTTRDLAGQLQEQDVLKPVAAPPWSAANHEPLFTKPASMVFSELKQEAMVEAFRGMDLPELEIQESANEEAEVVELFIRDSKTALLIPEEEKPSLIPPSEPRFVWPLGWKKAIAGFVALSFLFVVPIHAMQKIEQAKNDGQKIQASGIQALSRFSRGASDLTSHRYEDAADDFRLANASFLSAQQKINDLSGTLDAILRTAPQVSGTYGSLTSLLDAGEALTESAALFASALNEIRDTTSDSPIVKLDILTTYIEHMQPLLQQASEDLQHVSTESLPMEYQTQVTQAKETVPLLASSAEDFLTMNKALRTILGADGPMRYLVLFQNNSEIRPTGGFIGSFAEMTIEDGTMTTINIPAGGSYDLQGSLQAFVEAPQPLQLLRARWEFQDANWFADFPTSAKKILWFYDQSGGPTVDGVMAVNATFVADLLRLLGPIDMPEYNETVSGETFLEVTQHIVEHQENRDSGKPKQFIADLAPKLLEQTRDADTMTFLSLLQRVGQGLHERDIQFFLKNPQLMQTVDQLGWSGKLVETQGDSLMVVNSNVGGGKTDVVIDENITVDVAVQPDGSLIDTVTITRTHTGEKNTPFTGINNVNYQRLYVPLGSTLLSATGDFAAPDASLFETSDIPLKKDTDVASTEENTSTDPSSGTTVSEESNRTVFANWTQTRPGESSTVVYTYRLPFTLANASTKPSFFDQIKAFVGWSEAEPYTLFIQKQPGAVSRSTNVRVHLPVGSETRWASDDALLTTQGLTTNNAQDISAALLFDASF